MELLKDTPFEVAWQQWMAKPDAPCLTVVIKASFTVVERGLCPIDPVQELPTGDLHVDDDTERSVRYESDFAFIKPRGECLLTGSGHAPHGVPTTVAMVAFKVGTITKKMAVIGNRHFKGLLGGQTDPVPFTSMPLTWERSFGGLKNKTNPVGLGMGKSVVDGKAVIRLPNIENPDDLIRSRRQRPDPVGAFPIPRSWPARMKLTGTYDKRWQKSRWPWLPEDFQWDYFNAAPADQQLKGFFNGNEKLSLLHLHPTIAKATCQLPGLRARAFLRHADGDGFEGLTPELDTVTIDADTGKVLCVWRAVKELASEDLTQFSHLFVIHEPRDSRRSRGDYRQWFERRLEEEQQQEEEAFEAEPVPEEEPPPAGTVEPRTFPPPRPEPAPADDRPAPPRAGGAIRPGASALPLPESLIFKEPPAEEEPGEFACGQTMIFAPLKREVLPDPVPLDSPVLMPELTPEELAALYAVDIDPDEQGEATELMDPSALAAALAHGEAIEDPSAPLPFEEALDAESSMVEDLYAIDLDEELEGESTELFDPSAFADFMAEEEAKRTSSPGDEAAAEQWESRPTAMLLEQLSGFMPQVEDLELERSDEPLEAPAYAGKAPVEDQARGTTDAEGPAWAGTVDTEDRPPHRPTPAKAARPSEPPAEAELTEEQRLERQRVLNALKNGEGCAGWDLTDAVLAGLDLSGGDFTDALLTRADLSGATLDGATLDGATLMGAQLAGASLRGASLVEADLTEAEAVELVLEEVNLDDAVAIGTIWTGATMKKVSWRRAELGGSDLTGVRLQEVQLDEADLSGATLDGARFSDASLVDTDLGPNTSAREVSFQSCDLTKLRASEGVDLTGASMMKLTMSGARLQNAKLSEANLSFSRLDGADFSDALMNKAKLVSCHLRKARFDRAILADAELGKSDLCQARLEAANLLRTDLRGCNLYQAELYEAQMHETRLELANLTGTKLV